MAGKNEKCCRSEEGNDLDPFISYQGSGYAKNEREPKHCI